MATQLIPTTPREKSSLMDGNAILMDAPRNGLIKEVRITTKRIRLREVLLREFIMRLHLKIFKYRTLSFFYTIFMALLL